MSDYDFGSAWRALAGLLVFLFLFLPLGIWKLIEIIVWVCRHVHIN